MSAKVSKVQKEKDFLAQTSESLLRNQDDFRTQLAAEQAAARSKDEQIKDLTDQVRISSWYLTITAAKMDCCFHVNLTWCFMSAII